MNARTALARSATSCALRMRSAARIKPWEAIDVFDLAQNAGVEVRFTNIPSMEGMYLRQDAPVILISSERPAGRQRFTCAHELGHHAFGHGGRIDELLEDDRPKTRRQDDEILADIFAGTLLMPKSAVDRAFATRNVDPRMAKPSEMFRVSSWLGVGYSTLAKHLRYALNQITDERLAELLRATPKSIREALLGCTTTRDLIVVDEQWVGRSVDAAVDDLLLLPHDVTLEGRFCTKQAELPCGVLFQAGTPGIGRFESSRGWAAFVRVSRKNYEGLSIFRHIEEVEDE
jgi:Zn-dependent peptidase ImmA (M78 family)